MWSIGPQCCLYHSTFISNMSMKINNEFIPHKNTYFSSRFKVQGVFIIPNGEISCAAIREKHNSYKHRHDHQTVDIETWYSKKNNVKQWILLNTHLIVFKKQITCITLNALLCTFINIFYKMCIMSRSNNKYSKCCSQS